MREHCHTSMERVQASGRGPLEVLGYTACSVLHQVWRVPQALMERIRGQLDEEDLGTFRSHAAAYMRGDTDAESYYVTVASLGLASLVPDMAALLPDPLKRGELLSLHSAAAASPSDAAAAAVHASQNASWQCQRCSLINGPAAGSSCEACGSRQALSILMSCLMLAPHLFAELKPSG